MSNLLVIDWDYFFPNPLEALHVEAPDFWLYDWGHQEGNRLHAQLWPMRAAGFMRHEFPLPQVVVPPGWWDRFTFAPGAVCEVSDSNMYSGVWRGGAQLSPTFRHVWLYDAHHDLYRIKTRDDLRAWADKGEVNCETWMYAHWVTGSRLHWRWPQWHTKRSGASLRADIPKWVGCDARRDDMARLDPHMEFDAVSICRSGYWVPPWCDNAFADFVQACPVAKTIDMDGVLAPPGRQWDTLGVVAAADTLASIRRAEDIAKADAAANPGGEWAALLAQEQGGGA